MPVLRRHDGGVASRGEQCGDARDDGVAVVAGERAARHEIGLQVDHEQGSGFWKAHGFGCWQRTVEV